MEAVIEAMIEEKMSMANSSTTMDMTRSGWFLALMSMDAGVNCVKLQCNAVEYR